MIVLNVLVDARDTLAALSAMEEWIATGRCVEIAGEEVLRRSREAFAAEANPNNAAPWTPLRPNTLLKKRGPSILVESGKLLGSLFRGDGSNIWRRISPTYLQVGTSDDKAEVHHKGGRRRYRIVAKNTSDLIFPTTEGTFVGPSVWHPANVARPFFADGEVTAELAEVKMAESLEAMLRSRGV